MTEFDCFFCFFFQGKLELVTGAGAGTMKVEVRDQDGRFICALTSESALLGSYPVDDGMTLHVTIIFEIV